MITVLIVDDDPFIRESLKLILELEEGLQVAGVCANGHEAAAFAAAAQQLDVILMDIRMPECDGVEATRQIRSLPDPPAVLILTTFDDDEYIVEAIRCGAGGYLLKNVPPAKIVAAIKTVHEGELLIHPEIGRKLAGLIGFSTRTGAAQTAHTAGERAAWLHAGLGDSPSPIGADAAPRQLAPYEALAPYKLNATEVDMIRCIADGLSNREIAGQLFLSEGTVKNYISTLLHKLGLRDRTQLAIFYLKLSHGGHSR